MSCCCWAIILSLFMTLLSYIKRKHCATIFSVWATWCCWVFWEDPVSDQPGGSQGQDKLLYQFSGRKVEVCSVTSHFYGTFSWKAIRIEERESANNDAIVRSVEWYSRNNQQSLALLDFTYPKYLCKCLMIPRCLQTWYTKHNSFYYQILP